MNTRALTSKCDVPSQLPFFLLRVHNLPRDSQPLPASDPHSLLGVDPRMWVRIPLTHQWPKRFFVLWPDGLLWPKTPDPTRALAGTFLARAPSPWAVHRLSRAGPLLPLAHPGRDLTRLPACRDSPAVPGRRLWEAC